MRTRLAVLMVLAACAGRNSPDPRARPLTEALHDGHGGWIKLKLSNHYEAQGELISVDKVTVSVMATMVARQVLTVPKQMVVSAELWAWSADDAGGLVGWGTVGALSSITHGKFLFLSVPIWLLSTAAAYGSAAQDPVIEYPQHGWETFAMWARFPQGMPPGLTVDDLILKDRRPRPTRAPVPPAPAAPAAPVSPAAPTSGPSTPAEPVLVGPDEPVLVGPPAPVPMGPPAPDVPVAPAAPPPGAGSGSSR